MLVVGTLHQTVMEVYGSGTFVTCVGLAFTRGAEAVYMYCISGLRGQARGRRCRRRPRRAAPVRAPGPRPRCSHITAAARAHHR